MERVKTRKELRESKVIDTSSENWMQPFGLALGISNEEFEPWRKALFHSSESVVLVEGKVDEEYFRLLQQPELGEHSLTREMDIVPYGGKDSIKSPFFLKFFLGRLKHCFITYDLDADAEVFPILTTAGFEKGRNCFAIGTEMLKSIEGLLPASIIQTVTSNRHDIVSSLAFGDKHQKTSAKSNYKMALLEEFKKSSRPTDEFYKGFHPLIKSLNKALAKQSK